MRKSKSLFWVFLIVSAFCFWTFIGTLMIRLALESGGGVVVGIRQSVLDFVGVFSFVSCFLSAILAIILQGLHKDGGDHYEI
jgi:hypothetical protein